MDLSAVAVAKRLTHLPVFVDPSHATGKRELVETMSLSAVMAGCDGLEIEVHSNPQNALSDKEQQLLPKDFEMLLKKTGKLVEFRKQLEV